ncbi:hypothetical protein C1H46_018124 [Malus baccata]|uniref:RNase H type-1 domain-containing protein n=1 Tax=Malus baccata TaxID=106549 RepID=A0A540MCB3_MALBA|nr:hypothetical protein C1H46_018124 [Malus baccata]
MHWELPRDGWAKLSVDGTFKLKEGYCVAGSVIRGDGGLFVAAGVWKFQGVASVKQVELLAIREGMQLSSR